ncbi:DUF1592 domain-containing protein [Sandaracinus amylolyticus]|uniref:Cellulose-binding domain protein n=1 Tax=Sandaracinus amylolyticus TaxID=927083 RepID=A0A0F6W1F8_9BACT|nr:DUF1592 domain-containing protein [Sandaracinus amylolyticus]AKF04796.1 Hypothetical protein DB32_001945 [Sandaracinus amylolyticus]
MRFRSLTALAVLSLAACDGSLLDPRGSGPGTVDGWGPEGPSGPGGPTVPAEPGRVTMRRLNRSELDHTVRDLLGIERQVSTDFPADDRGYGYDNNGDVLSTSALHVELLASSAEEWIDEALGTAEAPGPGRERMLTCDVATGGESCARTILTTFTRRAWRRPATDAEITRLLSVHEIAQMHGDGWPEGVRLALIATLISPHFLYRVELDDPAVDGPERVSDYELASRLSYFLWASAPDDELLDLAADGVLHDEATLRAQAERMLDDARARSLVDDFAGQWLYTRLIPDHDADDGTFPDWTPELARSAQGEMERFFAAFLEEDRPVEDMLTASFGFVDDRLAAHYGVEIPEGTTRDEQGFARVMLPDTRSAGLLSRAGVLAVTSQPNRTSPVKRGVWVLEQILCSPPPPPPPGVEGLEATEPREGETLRERFERHRSDPVCASCHSVMDPIGFGLERYDAIGRYRETDNDGTIDDSGLLPGFGEFTGASELGAMISSDPRFPRCVTRQMMTYALGRGVEHRSDEAWVDMLTEDMLANGGTLRALILEIVTSPPFRMRGADHGAEDE